jgi:hypothetical protein
MSGSSHALADTCRSVVEQVGASRVIRDCLYFLLYHQYVKTNVLPDRLFQTVEGAGMGLSHSSEVANTALAAASPIVQAKYCHGTEKKRNSTTKTHGLPTIRS